VGREIDYEDRVGHNVREFFEEGREEFWKSAFDQVLKEGKPFEVWGIPEGRRPDGSTRYVHRRILPIRSPDGSVVGAINTWEDVTDQVARERNGRLREAVDMVREAVLEMRGPQDVDKVLDSIYRGLRVLGVPFSHASVQVIEGNELTAYYLLEGQKFSVHHLPLNGTPAEEAWRENKVVYRRDIEVNDVYKERELIKRAWKEDIRSVLDVPFSHGTIAMNSTLPDAFSDEDIAILRRFADVISVGFTRLEDLRKLEHKVRELAETEERYRSLVEGLLVGICIIQDGTIKFVNRAVEELTKYSRDEAIGMNILDFISPKDLNMVRERMLRREKGEDVLSYPLRYIRKDGEERWAEIYASRISYEGRPAILVNFIDITERRRLEEERERLRERLMQSEKLASIGQLVAGVAHELNNPLTVVTGYAELAVRRTQDEALRSQLRQILESAQRAASIVQNLLSFARKRPLEKRALNLRKLLEKVVELRAYELRTSNIEVVRKYYKKPIFVSGDPIQLQQVFINLIANAEQAMYSAHGGGRLTLRTEVKDDQALVHVQDDGPGMPKEVQRRIFEPFFTTKGVGEGTGLGLSVAYGIVREHGGDIWVESEPGKGATFTVSLPLAEPEEVREEERTEAVPEGRLKVLVVDDEPGIRGFIREYFSFVGYEVHEAGEGEEALKLLRKGDYDVIFSDIKMPGMDGKEFFAWVKEHRPELIPKIVFITGDVARSDTQDFIRTSGVMCLNKPFGIGDLNEILRKLKQEGRASGPP
ncbi:MAG: hypothetical protein DRQ08_03990, partial [Candidatus Latescibacterota bacterium]